MFACIASTDQLNTTPTKSFPYKGKISPQPSTGKLAKSYRLLSLAMSDWKISFSLPDVFSLPDWKI